MSRILVTAGAAWCIFSVPSGGRSAPEVFFLFKESPIKGAKSLAKQMQQRDDTSWKMYQDSVTRAEKPSFAEEQRQNELKAHTAWKEGKDYRKPPPGLVSMNYADPAQRQAQRQARMSSADLGVFGLGNSADANPTAVALAKQNQADEYDRDASSQYESDVRGEDQYQRTGNSNLLMAQDWARNSTLLNTSASMSNNATQARIQTQPQSLLPAIVGGLFGAGSALCSATRKAWRSRTPNPLTESFPLMSDNKTLALAFRLILFFCLLFGLALAARATTITISAVSIPNIQAGAGTYELRIWLDRTMVDSLGVTYVGGAVDSPNGYKRVACALVSTTVTCDTFTLASTVDAQQGADAKYAAKLYRNNAPLLLYNKPFALPASLGASVTWEQIWRYNNTVPNRVLDNEYYTKNQVNALYTGSLFANPATTTSRGVGKSSMNVADPVFVETTDPRVPTPRPAALIHKCSSTTRAPSAGDAEFTYNKTTDTLSLKNSSRSTAGSDAGQSFAETINGEGVSWTAVEPNAGNNNSDRVGFRLTRSTDATRSTPNFSNETNLELTSTVTRGQNDNDGAGKRTFFELYMQQTAYGWGQRFLQGGVLGCYGWATVSLRAAPTSSTSVG
jgi:hypothetical protein